VPYNMDLLYNLCDYPGDGKDNLGTLDRISVPRGHLLRRRHQRFQIRAEKP
jgi:hypothetical protein